MPYIAREHRQELDGLIDQLALCLVKEARKCDHEGAVAGLLNYACTRLALKVVRERFGTLRYWLIALLTGIFKNVADEFYRRLGGALRRPSTGPSGGCGGLPGISGGNPQ